jgi:hypothetical protein
MSRDKKGYQTALVAMLEQRGPLASEFRELLRASGLRPRAYFNVISKLSQRGLIHRWRNELDEEYLVLAKHAGDAYYFVEIQTPDICHFFGQPRTARIRRSAPFVNLVDPDLRVRRFNRYNDVLSVA